MGMVTPLGVQWLRGIASTSVSLPRGAGAAKVWGGVPGNTGVPHRMTSDIPKSAVTSCSREMLRTCVLQGQGARDGQHRGSQNQGGWGQTGLEVVGAAVVGTGEQG